jgi:hypothetical protein
MLVVQRLFLFSIKPFYDSLWLLKKQQIAIHTDDSLEWARKERIKLYFGKCVGLREAIVIQVRIFFAREEPFGARGGFFRRNNLNRKDAMQNGFVVCCQGSVINCVDWIAPLAKVEERRNGTDEKM